MRLPFLATLWFTLLSALCASLEGAPTISGEEALLRLVDGNRGFATSDKSSVDRATMRSTYANPKPIAVVVACSDCPHSPELLFGQPLGELFVIRLAGPTVDELALGSVEWGIAQWDIPLLVILGHTGCQAISSAMEPSEEEPQSPTSRLRGALKPSVLAVQVREREKELDPTELLKLTTEANVATQVQNLIQGSQAITERILSGRLKIASGLYNGQSGEVRWLGIQGRTAIVKRPPRPATKDEPKS